MTGQGTEWSLYEEQAKGGKKSPKIYQGKVGWQKTAASFRSVKWSALLIYYLLLKGHINHICKCFEVLSVPFSQPGTVLDKVIFSNIFVTNLYHTKQVSAKTRGVQETIQFVFLGAAITVWDKWKTNLVSSNSHNYWTNKYSILRHPN